jgi:hypothetical protein
MFNNKFNNRFNNRFSRTTNKTNKTNKTMNSNTNITVEKIDTTETAHTNKNIDSHNNNKSLSSGKQSSKYSESIKKTTNQKDSNNLSKKLTLEEEIINNIETLEDLPLVLSNVSENEKHSMIDTDTLLYARKKSKLDSEPKTGYKYTLDFPRTEIISNDKYNKLNKYVKKNYKSIVDLLYNKKLLKNKNTPYRIVYHIYVNYLNEDLNIIVY